MTTARPAAALLVAALVAMWSGRAACGPLPLETSPYDNVIPVFGQGSALPREDGRGYEAVMSPEAANFLKPARVETYGLQRFPPGMDGAPEDDAGAPGAAPHFMVPAEVVHAAERAEQNRVVRSGEAPPQRPVGPDDEPGYNLPASVHPALARLPGVPRPLGAGDKTGPAAGPGPGAVSAPALAETGASAAARRQGGLRRRRFIKDLFKDPIGTIKKGVSKVASVLGIKPKTALTVGGVVAGGVAVAKLAGVSVPKTPFTASSVATASKALPFDPAKLADRPPPLPGRTLDPNFDKLDMPEKCPGRCSGNGQCLIDKTRLVPQGLVEVHPYKCVCGAEWTGVACQTRVDMYIRWFESSGVSAFPKCCLVEPSQFRVPSNYDQLPAYQNPFSVSNCDPQLSVDSRPDASGRPPCWRPLSAVGVRSPGDEAAEAKAASLLEAGAYARARAGGLPDPADVVAANEAEKKRLAERLKVPVPECCLPCDFDFWSQVNSRPENPLRPGRGRDYVRALERQRVSEQFGGQAVIRELKRREKMRELEDKQRRREDDPFAAALLEVGLTPEQQRQRDAARAERRDEREARRRGARGQADPQNPAAARGPTCVICPVPAADPLGVDMQKYYKEKGVDDKKNNRFGSFLRRGRGQPTKPCCNTCPSAFWIRTVSKDTDPFYGPEVKPPPVVLPGDEASADEGAGDGTTAPATEGGGVPSSTPTPETIMV